MPPARAHVAPVSVVCVVDFTANEVLTFRLVTCTVGLVNVSQSDLVAKSHNPNWNAPTFNVTLPRTIAFTLYVAPAVTGIQMEVNSSVPAVFVLLTAIAADPWTKFVVSRLQDPVPVPV